MKHVLGFAAVAAAAAPAGIPAGYATADCGINQTEIKLTYHLVDQFLI